MDILNTKIKSILTEKNTKILPANIKSGVTILGVAGGLVINKYYTGSTAPSSSLGNDGDLYLQTS